MVTRSDIVGYFEWLGIECPPAYASLIARVLPLQVELPPPPEPLKNWEELEEVLRERGLPTGQLYPLLQLKPIEQEQVEVPREDQRR
jgi:hypothetical protein